MSVSPIRFAQVVVENVVQSGGFESPVDLPNLLSAFRIGNDRPVLIRNGGGAMRARAVTIEKTRQTTHRDVGAGETDESVMTHDRKCQEEHRVTGIWIDPRL